MTISRNVLCIVYGLIGLVALVGCWGNNLQYLNLNLGMLGVNAHFWGETLANPASRSITIDLLFLSLAAIVWMVLEARRLSMRGVWIYVLLGAFVAISAAFPAFMIHRERALAGRDGSSSAGTLSAADVLGVMVLGLCVLAYLFIALGR
jgi:hypothetical protein